MIESIYQGLKADRDTVPIAMLCKWFRAARCMVYYKEAKKAALKPNP